MKRFLRRILLAGGVIFFLILGFGLIGGIARRSGLLLKDGVGVVEVKGMILDSQETVRYLEKCRKDPHVKAVVLRVDTPGGVVAPSQEIHDEVKRLKKTKPVVVSMGALAASGGYYIAAPATRIWANPGTLTGSIGVIAKFFNLQQAMDRFGVRMTVVKTGQYKDTGSVARQMSRDEHRLMQNLIDSTYVQFVRAVAEGRRIPEAEVKKVADGRILTGEQAHALKLVDRLGGLEDAIADAAQLAGLKGEPETILFRKKEGFLKEMMTETRTALPAGLAPEPGFTLSYEADLLH